MAGWQLYVDRISWRPRKRLTENQTDEQAPLPGVFSQLLDRVRSGLECNADFVFNCQMGRGRTTTGMVTACLIATTNAWADRKTQAGRLAADAQEEVYDSLDGPSEEEAYMQGECSPCRPFRWGLV